MRGPGETPRGLGSDLCLAAGRRGALRSGDSGRVMDRQRQDPVQKVVLKGRQRVEGDVGDVSAPLEESHVAPPVAQAPREHAKPTPRDGRVGAGAGVGAARRVRARGERRRQRAAAAVEGPAGRRRLRSLRGPLRLSLSPSSGPAPAPPVSGVSPGLAPLPPATLLPHLSPPRRRSSDDRPSPLDSAAPPRALGGAPLEGAAGGRGRVSARARAESAQASAPARGGGPVDTPAPARPPEGERRSGSACGSQQETPYAGEAPPKRPSESGSADRGRPGGTLRRREGAEGSFEGATPPGPRRPRLSQKGVGSTPTSPPSSRGGRRADRGLPLGRQPSSSRINRFKLKCYSKRPLIFLPVTPSLQYINHFGLALHKTIDTYSFGHGKWTGRQGQYVKDFTFWTHQPRRCTFHYDFVSDLTFSSTPSPRPLMRRTL